jgi:hypothetical protein
MASAQVALATITLGSAASTVTFSSIPATYRDLRLVIQASSPADTADIVARFNGDSGANYSLVQMYGNGSTATSSASSGQTELYFGYYNTTQGMVQLTVFDYSQTDKQKSALSRSDLPGALVFARAGRWASTSAITSMLIYPTYGQFAAGSTFSLYGIVSA